MALLAGGLALVLALFLGTDLGLAMRAAGNNPQMAKAVGIDVDRMIVLGLGLSNGLIALSGALFAQYEGFANIQMGIGAMVTGVATLMVGETLLGKRPLGRWIAGAVAGRGGLSPSGGGRGEGRAEPERAQAGDRAPRPERCWCSPTWCAEPAAGVAAGARRAMPETALRLEAVSHVFHPGTPERGACPRRGRPGAGAGHLHRGSRHQRVGEVQPPRRDRRQPDAGAAAGFTWTGGR